MPLFSSNLKNLQQLFAEQLRDLYDGEQQISRALPKLIGKASSSELREALRAHLEETRQQIVRLDRIFLELGMKPSGESCKGLEGVIAEGDHLLSICSEPSLIDACIIASAQRVEHYEIAGYGTAKAFARQLGWGNFAQILDKTLDEEKEADRKLSELAEDVNLRARRAA